VAGRPVHFSSAMTAADDDLAQRRLEVALGRVGFKKITFEFEPIVAAYHYGPRSSAQRPCWSRISAAAPATFRC
jgi:hypothetical protein